MSTKRRASAKPQAGAEKLDRRLAAIAEVFALDSRVSVGKLFASVGLRVDGKIFAMVVKGRLVLKLPKARVDQLLAQKAGVPFEAGTGRVMREWIALTLAQPDAVSLGREAFAFVSSR